MALIPETQSFTVRIIAVDLWLTHAATMIEVTIAVIRHLPCITSTDLMPWKLLLKAVTDWLHLRMSMTFVGNAVDGSEKIHNVICTCLCGRSQQQANKSKPENPVSVHGQNPSS
jgi:hypothetical protein